MTALRIAEPSLLDYERSRKDPNKPPVFRDSDFAMRFEQGKWSEERLVQAINSTDELRAIPYGRSQIGPGDREKIKDYWRDYCAAETKGKRPDLLVVRRSDYDWAMTSMGDDPTTAPEERCAPVVAKAICGIEAENSLWIAKRMKDFHTTVPLRTVNPIAPNIWVKEQDIPGLKVWMYHYRKPVVVVQVFYDAAYAVELADVLAKAAHVEASPQSLRAAVSKEIGVFVRVQKYPDARGGASTKTVLVTHHSVAVRFGELTSEPVADARVIMEANGRIMPYVAFSGGALRVTAEGVTMLHSLG